MSGLLGGTSFYCFTQTLKENVSGLLGGEEEGAEGYVGPLPKLLGDIVPPSVPTPMLILSFKEEPDISSLNGHVEIITNTVIRLWMHRLVRTCAFGGNLRVR